MRWEPQGRRRPSAEPVVRGSLSAGEYLGLAQVVVEVQDADARGRRGRGPAPRPHEDLSARRRVASGLPAGSRWSSLGSEVTTPVVGPAGGVAERLRAGRQDVFGVHGHLARVLCAGTDAFGVV
jgi:hypothetical protein